MGACAWVAAGAPGVGAHGVGADNRLGASAVDGVKAAAPDRYEEVAAGHCLADCLFHFDANGHCLHQLLGNLQGPHYLFAQLLLSDIAPLCAVLAKLLRQWSHEMAPLELQLAQMHFQRGWAGCTELQVLTFVFFLAPPSLLLEAALSAARS